MWEGAGEGDLDVEDAPTPLILAVLPRALWNELEPGQRAELERARWRMRAARPVIEEASEVDAVMEKAGRLTTGCRLLDELLGGGVRAGIPLAVVGASGTGKSQFAYHIVAVSLMAHPDLQALWVDTNHAFRPERVYEIVSRRGGNPTQVLDRLLVRRTVGSGAQMAAIRGLSREGARGTILVLDDVYTNFEMDYPGLERSIHRLALLRMHLLEVADITYRALLYTLLIFPVRFRPEEAQPAPAGLPPYFNPPAQLWLSREGEMRYATYSLMPARRVGFRISEAGLEDAGPR